MQRGFYGHNIRERDRNYSNIAHDRKKGSPRLQRKRDPKRGGSVGTMLSATHVLASLDLNWPMKSRGSIGNI